MKTLGTTVTFALLATLAGCAAPITDSGSDIDPDPEYDADEEGPLAEAEDALGTPAAHYMLKNPGGDCMDVAGASNSAGFPVVTWPCHYQLHQAFGLVFHNTTVPEVVEGNEVQLVARHSGQCLDVENGSSQSGARIIQWPCHDGANQRFYLWSFGAGKLGLKSKGSGLCVVKAPGAVAGNSLIQADCDTAADANRVWYFEQTTVPGAPPAGMTVSLYPHVDYQGTPLTLSADVPDLGVYSGWNEAVSSVTLSAGGFVTVYSDVNYGGRCETIFASTPDLFKRYIGNDSISSLRLGSHCRTVVLFEDSGYGGDSISFQGDVQTLVDYGWNDRTSSILVSPGSTVTTFQHTGYWGTCQNLSNSLSTFATAHVGNDQLSSLRFGPRCGQRNIGVKNNGEGLSVKYFLRENGVNGPWSDKIDYGERLGTVFNDTRNVEVHVLVHDGVYYADVCQVPVTTSSDRTINVWGSKYYPSCSE